LLGDAYLANKNLDAAEREFRTALEEDKDSKEARLRLANVLSWKKDYAGALAQFELLIKAHPGDLELPTRVAEISLWSGDTKAAKNTKQKEGKPMSKVSIRYMIDDVPAAVKFYTTHLGFALDLDASPAFASVSRDGVRLLLSGKTSSGRIAMPDGREPVPGGWNRIQVEVDDLDAEVKRLRKAGLKFRNEIVKGPGGAQILLDDPSGNPVELFQPAKKE
jgi:predicted enzyme related to lactoylglutathione lyase